MSILEELTLLTLKQPRKIKGVDERIAVRKTMISGLERQLELIDMKMKGVDSDVISGKHKRATRFSEIKGCYYFWPTYGNVPVTLNGHNAVCCGGELASVREIIGKLIRAVENGEIDQEILEARKSSPLALSKRRKIEANKGQQENRGRRQVENEDSAIVDD